MFNKYLLVSTLVCGLMSVSMGDIREGLRDEGKINPEKFESKLRDIQIYVHENPGSESEIRQHLETINTDLGYMYETQ